jgi:Cytochrome P460
MGKKLTYAIALLALGAATAAVSADRPSTSTAPARERYLPEYTRDGDLMLPKNWRSWVYVGSPLTPDGLNGGHAGFPEYHNVYIEPGSFEIYTKTGEFPEGTIMFKELQRVLKPQHFPDGSRTEPSGRGYFPGEFNGADVSVKDSKRYAQIGSTWGYYNFNHHEPKALTAKVRPKSDCTFCHIEGAKKDEVWTQFYRLLDN